MILGMMVGGDVGVMIVCVRPPISSWLLRRTTLCDMSCFQEIAWPWVCNTTIHKYRRAAETGAHDKHEVLVVMYYPGQYHNTTRKTRKDTILQTCGQQPSSQFRWFSQVRRKQRNPRTPSKHNPNRRHIQHPHVLAPPAHHATIKVWAKKVWFSNNMCEEGTQFSQSRSHGQFQTQVPHTKRQAQHKLTMSAWSTSHVVSVPTPNVNDFLEARDELVHQLVDPAPLVRGLKFEPVPHLRHHPEHVSTALDLLCPGQHAFLALPPHLLNGHVDVWAAQIRRMGWIYEKKIAIIRNKIRQKSSEFHI